MKITRLITIFLSLNILLSNMAWAVDECSLTAEISNQTSSQLDLDIEAGSAENSVFSDNTPAGNSCNTFCPGWSHLNYISYTSPVITVIKPHSKLVAVPVIYHFTQHKPPTEPPKV